jgi:hypothetical protein
MYIFKHTYTLTHTHTHKRKSITHNNLDTIIGTILSIHQSVYSKECIVFLLSIWCMLKFCPYKCFCGTSTSYNRNITLFDEQVDGAMGAIYTVMQFSM